MIWPLSYGELSRLDRPGAPELVAQWCASEGIAEPAERLVTRFYLPMADWIATHADERLVVVGLNGAQGTGKSTLARLLSRLLERLHGLRVASFSLDDLYFGVEARLRRAQSIHPLLVTRGVPGTHDVGLGVRTLEALRGGKPLALPRFDKATDDRAPVARWPRWEGPCDVVLFDGWCVGARPQPASALHEPINALERDEDPRGDWRWYVNRELGGAYQALFAELDMLVMLCPPDFDRVYAWREQQEAGLREARPGPGVMTPEAVRRFVMHFERLTRFMWEEMPGRADAVIDLGDDHLPVQVQLGDR